MLLPILQKVASGSAANGLGAQRYSELPFQPVFSSTPNSSMILDDSLPTPTFSVEELLTKAKKNTKSTDAQIELRVSFINFYVLCFSISSNPMPIVVLEKLGTVIQ